MADFPETLDPTSKHTGGMGLACYNILLHATAIMPWQATALRPIKKGLPGIDRCIF